MSINLEKLLSGIFLYTYSIHQILADDVAGFEAAAANSPSSAALWEKVNKVQRQSRFKFCDEKLKIIKVLFGSLDQRVI